MYISLYLAWPWILLNTKRDWKIAKILYWPKEIDDYWIFDICTRIIGENQKKRGETKAKINRIVKEIITVS